VSIVDSRNSQGTSKFILDKKYCNQLKKFKGQGVVILILRFLIFLVGTLCSEDQPKKDQG